MAEEELLEVPVVQQEELVVFLVNGVVVELHQQQEVLELMVAILMVKHQLE
jgi:hypothetical protein